MNKFNFHRFLQYARYDLTLNRAFYRNLAIVTASCIIGITILGFLIRWSMFSTAVNNDYPEYIMMNSAGIQGTIACITIFGCLMSLIFAGCVNHPLRNKQGRISTLTLPANNAEKFTWHVLLMAVGGLLLFTVSVILADGVNALFSWMAGFPCAYIFSLTKAIIGPLFGFYSASDLYEALTKINGPMTAIPSTRVLVALMAFSYLASLWSILVFMYGNALKYRHNIIWTILSLIVLQFVTSVVSIIVMVQIASHLDTVNPDMISPELFKQYLWGGYWIVMGILTITGTSMAIACWRRYKNAQLVDKWNK